MLLRHGGCTYNAACYNLSYSDVSVSQLLRSARALVLPRSPGWNVLPPPVTTKLVVALKLHRKYLLHLPPQLARRLEPTTLLPLLAPPLAQPVDLIRLKAIVCPPLLQPLVVTVGVQHLLRTSEPLHPLIRV